MAAILFLAVGAIAQTNNTLSDAEIEGRGLARQLADAKPTGNYTNNGLLKIRDGKGNSTNYPVVFTVSINAAGWIAVYDATQKPGPGQAPFVYAFSVEHKEGGSNIYTTFVDHGLGAAISVTQTMFPFRHSDFWICDLGLEFFHWPSQKIIKKEFSRGRGCMVLESVNPDPTNGYSRVDSWIDEETDGIVHAEAFDPKGKLLKVFDPKSFKKVNGQWQLEGMEIRNVQTGSRTRIEFDLGNKPGTAGVPPAR